MNWRLQKSKGFQGKYIHKYDLDQNIIVRAWCNHICDQSSLWGKLDQWGSAHHVKVFEHGNLIIRESADFTLLIIGNPGALVTFFNYIPGLLFPKKII